MAAIGTTEAAERLGISPRRVAGLIEQGVLKAAKVGKTWIIEESEIMRFSKITRKPGRPRKK